MGIGDKVNTELNSWGAVGITIVIISVILLKIKSQNVGNSTCGFDGNGNALTFNQTGNNCYNSTGYEEAIQGTGSTIDTIVAALSEPANWIIIVIIGIVGFALLKMFKNRKG